MDAATETLLRAAHRSLGITWGTTAPFAIGATSAERVGYADIPSTRTTVWCRDNDISALVPIVRQRVFAELAERGWGDEHVEFTPTVQRRSIRMFEDSNEASQTCGRRRRGVEHVVHFEARGELRDRISVTIPYARRRSRNAARTGTYQPLPYATMPERSTP